VIPVREGDIVQVDKNMVFDNMFDVEPVRAIRMGTTLRFSSKNMANMSPTRCGGAERRNHRTTSSPIESIMHGGAPRDRKQDDIIFIVSTTQLVGVDTGSNMTM
jgi:hypothetical protein